MCIGVNTVQIRHSRLFPAPKTTEKYVFIIGLLMIWFEKILGGGGLLERGCVYWSRYGTNTAL